MQVIVPELEAKESKLSGIPEEGLTEDCIKPSTCRIEVCVKTANMFLTMPFQGYQNLDRIASYLREQLPVEATLPSECIRHPTSGISDQS